MPSEDVKENLNKTHEIIEVEDDQFTEIKTDMFIKAEYISENTAKTTTTTTAAKRVSLISTSGFVRPNITETVAKPAQVSKLPSPPPPKKQPLAPPQPAAASFEFKRPAIPKLQSPPKLAVSSRLPVTSSTIRTSAISRASFGFATAAAKPKTLSVNNSTSNIYTKPSAVLPQQQPQSSVSRVRTATNSSESSKENNGLRASYNSAKATTGGSLTTLRQPMQVSMSLKISPPKMPTTGTSSSKLVAPSKIPEQVKSMIPAFKTSALPVSRISKLKK